MFADAELEGVARRGVWWLPPAQALEQPRLFLCHVMGYGLWEDALVIRQRFDRDDLCDALTHAPAGLFDLRSWHYWRRALGLPVPPLPVRRIPGTQPSKASSKADFHLRFS